jgi:ABC-type branched-subunit amino acid transport system permease subunit
MNVPPLNLGLLGGGPEVWDSVPVYYVTLALVFAVYLLLEALTRSRYGIVLRAIRDNQDRTGYFGYDTAGYKLTAFTIGAGVAGLAGAVFVTQFNFASPPLIGFALSTEVLIWVALGGRTLLLAAFLGAILVRSVENVLSETLGTYWLLALGLLFASSVVLFPRGLIGEVIHRLTAPRRGAVGSAPKPP